MNNTLELENFTIPMLSLDFSSTKATLQSEETLDFRLLSDGRLWKQLTAFITDFSKEDCVAVSHLGIYEQHSVDQAYLLSRLYEATNYDVKLLFADASGVGNVLPLSDHITWVDRIEESSLCLIYQSAYEDILNDRNSMKFFWNRLNLVTSQKLLIYPFASHLSHSKMDYACTLDKISLIKEIEALYKSKRIPAPKI